MENGEWLLVDALMSLGKSYGTIQAAAATEEPISILTSRGRKEQYRQFKEWCEDTDLDYRVLPSLYHDCPTAWGDFGGDWKNRVCSLYRQGRTGRAIHDDVQEKYGEKPPCQRSGECPYIEGWDFDASDFDVLIGHYVHAYVPPVVIGRTVVLDEFPAGAYESEFNDNPSEIVSHFLQTYEKIPFKYYDELRSNRHTAEGDEVLKWITKQDFDSYSEKVVRDDSAHTAAPDLVYTLLNAEDLGNGWERTKLPGTFQEVSFDRGRVGLVKKSNSAVYLLDPPDLSLANGIIGLDGTAIPELWETVLGLWLPHEQILTTDERRRYIRDVLGHEYVKTTEHVKPYSCRADMIPERVNLEKDATLLQGVAEAHDDLPSLITTARAEDFYEETGVLDLVAESKHYGDIRGSNDFDDTRVGVVIGSQHYGDGFVEKWSAYAGVPAEREGKGILLDYGPYGNLLLTHMREHQTLQAVMRFGRDGEGARIYIHTNTLPDWIPLEGTGQVLPVSDGMKQILEVLCEEQEEWRTEEITHYPTVEISKRQMRDHLKTLTKWGYIDRIRDGRGHTWIADELTSKEDILICPSDFAEVDDNRLYMWDFRNSPISS